MVVGKYNLFTLTVIVLTVTGLLGCTVEENSGSGTSVSSSPRVLQPIDRYEKMRENLPEIPQRPNQFNVFLPTELEINESLTKR